MEAKNATFEAKNATLKAENATPGARKCHFESFLSISSIALQVYKTFTFQIHWNIILFQFNLRNIANVKSFCL